MYLGLLGGNLEAVVVSGLGFAAAVYPPFQVPQGLLGLL